MKPLLPIIIILISCNFLAGQYCFPADISDVKIEESCIGDVVCKKINIRYHSDELITFTNLGSSLTNFKLIYDDDVIPIDSSFHIPVDDDVKNTILEFEIESLDEIPELYIQQKFCDKSFIDTIKIFQGHFFVKSGIQELFISDSCQDEIVLNLPFAGTQTDISFFEFKDGDYELLFRRTYYCCSWGNEVKLPKNALNKYKLGITGCHVRYSEFEFELK